MDTPTIRIKKDVYESLGENGEIMVQDTDNNKQVKLVLVDDESDTFLFESGKGNAL